MVSDELVLWNLRKYGSPLVGRGHAGEDLGLEKTLAYGLRLSRKDPSVAQVWPVVFSRNRDQVDLSRLETEARRLGQTRTLGFFLSLLRMMLKDRSLMPLEKKLRRKSVNMTYFFDMGQGALYRKLTRMRTPKVAKDWGFWMNTRAEDFRSFLRKFSFGH